MACSSVNVNGAPALSHDELVKVAMGAGLNQAQAQTAAAIAQAESSAKPGMHNPCGRDDSWGLWQINMLGGMGPARRAQLGIATNEQLMDPAVNARAMALISGGGTHWGDWTTYTSGAYKGYLGGGADTGTGATADPNQVGSEQTDPTENPCLIGDIVMPSSIPNIPCLFYKSWGWALLGGMALVGGAVVVAIGVVLVVARPPSVRTAARMATGPLSGLGGGGRDREGEFLQAQHERDAEAALARENKAAAASSRESRDTGYRPRRGLKERPSPSGRSTIITREDAF